MLTFEPAAWSPWIWVVHVLGFLYLLGFVVFFIRFDRLARAAAKGGKQERLRHDRALRGWPNNFYAKMLGRYPLQKPKRRR